MTDAFGTPAAMRESFIAPLAALAVTGAVLVGAAAVMVFSWASDDGWKAFIALGVPVAGLVIARPAGDPDHPRTRALGRPVLTGIGASAVVLGGYLIGSLLVALAIPDRATDAPQPAIVLLALLYGASALALLGLAVKGFAAGIVGLGLVVPLLAVLVLAEAGASAGTMAIIMLVLAIGLTVVVVRAPDESRIGRLAGVLGAMAASFAVGAGSSPFGRLTAMRPDSAQEASRAAAGTPAPWLMVVVLIGALAAAAILAIMAGLRRDPATGLIAASVFALPPTMLYARGADASLVPPARLALLTVPVLVAVLAVVALLSTPVRAAVERLVRRPVGTRALLVAIALAAVVFVVQDVPFFHWPPLLEGVIKLAVLAGAGSLALWVPGTGGAVLAGVTLVALSLALPWVYLLGGGGSLGVAEYRRSAIVALIVAAAATWVMWRRHRRPGVAAAAAYLLAGAVAFLLWTLETARYHLGLVDDDGQLQPMIVLIGPVLLLGVPAAVAALRGRETVAAAGQAVGAVLLVSIAVVPISVQLYDAAPDRVYELVSPLLPFTPTDVGLTSATLAKPTAVVYLAIGLVVLLALVLLVSVVRRPSAPLTAAVLLVTVVGAQTAVLGALAARGVTTADDVVSLLATAATVLGVAAVIVTRMAGRDRPNKTTD